MKNSRAAKMIADVLRAVYVDNPDAFERSHAKIRSVCDEIGETASTKEEIIGQMIADSLTRECRKERA